MSKPITCGKDASECPWEFVAEVLCQMCWERYCSDRWWEAMTVEAKMSEDVKIVRQSLELMGNYGNTREVALAALDRIEAELKKIAAMEEALDSIYMGGNHLASALIQWLGASEAKFPPYSAPFSTVRSIIKDANYYDAWVCWRAIMQARDRLRPDLAAEKTEAHAPAKCPRCGGAGVLNEFKGDKCLQCGGTGEGIPKPPKIYRDESTPEGREIWRDVEKAAKRAAAIDAFPHSVTECACRKALEEADRFCAALEANIIRMDAMMSTGCSRTDMRIAASQQRAKYQAALATPCECAGLRERAERSETDLLAAGCALASANERADANFASCERIKGKLSDAHADAMVAHRWFTEHFGEHMNGRDFAVKCPMAAVAIKRQRGDANERAERAEAGWKEAVEALRELRAMVQGECPSLLNEDSGGCARLDIDIAAAVARFDELRDALQALDAQGGK